MTEDTREWANADAGTTKRIATGITDFNVAQTWAQERRGQAPQSDFSKEDFEEALDKVSRPAPPSDPEK